MKAIIFGGLLNLALLSLALLASAYPPLSELLAVVAIFLGTAGAWFIVDMHMESTQC